MKRALLLCALATATLTAPYAKADVFAISFDGDALGYSGSGQFIGTLASPGVYDITGVRSGGTVTDPGFGTSAIVGLSGYAGSDNLLYYPGSPSSGQYFDDLGLSFALANGVDINLWDATVGSTLFENALESNASGDIPELVTETVTPIPEPSSLILIGTSTILGIARFLRRRLLS